MINEHADTSKNHMHLSPGVGVLVPEWTEGPGGGLSALEARALFGRTAAAVPPEKEAFGVIERVSYTLMRGLATSVSSAAAVTLT
jgi:hypothetical protein